MAVAPDTVGTGSRIGAYTDRAYGPSVMVASGELPPPDSASGEVDTAGDRVPLALRTRSGLRARQVPSTLARTGTASSVRLRVPFGLAVSVVVAVVAPVTGTALPVRFAWARACGGVW